MFSIYLILTISFYQYVNELYQNFSYRGALKRQPQTSILRILFKVFICGEYRSRTDDLLRARQAL